LHSIYTDSDSIVWDSTNETRVSLAENRYEILEPLGSGGQATVYLGYDTTLEREVAIKILPGQRSQNDAAIERFRREALRAANHSRTGNLLTGLLITLANPKVILFYLGLLPTFIDLTALTTSDILVVVLIVSGVLGLTMLGYALIASRARELVRNARVARAINRTAGGAMILAGATLATKA